MPACGGILPVRAFGHKFLDLLVTGAPIHFATGPNPRKTCVTPSEDVPLETGSIFHGRYQVLRHLKSGGMGRVYEVLHLETQRRRALKTMLPGIMADLALRERFRREATVGANIGSEHIIDVFDAGVDDATGLPFLVMDLLKGETLQAQLERRGRFGPVEVVAILYQVALALDRTHAAGVVHRDLKPENLFVTQRDDGTLRMIVLDFGIAKVVESASFAKTTQSLGTPLYMSPEQIRGESNVQPAADLYSLCHIAYALLVGEPFWTAESQSAGTVYGLLMRITQGAPEPPSSRAAHSGVSLPPEFDAWFARGTAASPSSRFDSAGEQVEKLAKAIGVVLPGKQSQQRSFALDGPRFSEAIASAAGRGASRRLRVLLALLGCGLVALTLLAWVFRRGHGPTNLASPVPLTSTLHSASFAAPPATVMIEPQLGRSDSALTSTPGAIAVASAAAPAADTSRAERPNSKRAAAKPTRVRRDPTDTW